jgi:hypothetical protein
MSHNEFQSSELIEPQEASPMKHEMHVLGIDGSERTKVRKVSQRLLSVRRALDIIGFKYC